MLITIDLEVPTYLHKYLTQTYGSIYKVSTNDELGILILNTLKKKTSPYYQYHTRKKTILKKYSMQISLSSFDKHGCVINKNDMILITKFIDKWFRYHIYRIAIINEKHMSIPFKTTITNYLQHYNISEADLSYDTIIRDFNRKKPTLLNLNTEN